MSDRIWVALSLGLLMAGGALLPGRAMAQTEMPQRGDRLKAIPGQPLCSDVNELVAYLRTQLGIDKRRRNFKTCGPMPTGTNYTILDVSADDPDVPLRPAKIRIVAPGGASITGWTVLVSED